MKVGDLVKPRHSDFLSGITLRLCKDGVGYLWLIQWSNGRRTYETEKHVEVLSESH